MENTEKDRHYEKRGLLEAPDKNVIIANALLQRLENTFCWLEHGELMDKSAFECNRFEINDIQTNRFF